mmetsp:Transcript_13684/g.22571  ORF Transcript_13684/g.22571 Transcript_13684/m.22571 type:complete len:266 (+) Transcript_13684:1007-1804(+)
MSARALMSKSSLRCSSLRKSFSMSSLLFESGTSIRTRFGSRRSTASSISKGLFVAASTITRSSSEDVNPSHALISSFRRPRATSFSPELRVANRASTSSKKIIAGLSFLANENVAAANFSDSPNHLLVRTLAVMFRNVAPHSAATALASRDLPVPGGPNNITPFVVRLKLPRSKRRGYCSGRMTSSFSVRFTPSNAATSANLTLMSSGTTTLDNNCLSLTSRAPTPKKRSSRWDGEGRREGWVVKKGMGWVVEEEEEEEKEALEP